jgi:hypothetical protein
MEALRRRAAPTVATLATGIALASASLTIGSPAFAANYKLIVDTNTPIPGGSTNFGLSLGDIPAVSGNKVAFRANGGEVWTATTAGRSKRKVITPNTRIPGGGGARFQLTYGTFIQIHGDTVVLVGSECFGCNSGLGLYTVPVAGGQKIRLVDVNTARPDDGTKTFNRFGDDFHVDGNHVVFSNGDGQIFSVPVAGGLSSQVAGGAACVDVPYCLFSQPTLDSFGQQVFMKGGDGFSNARLVRRARTGTLLEVVADKDTHPPNTHGTYRFDPFHESFNLPVLDRTADHRFSIFKGESAAPSRPRIVGIYSRGPSGFVKLADTRTQVPGGTGRFAPTGFVGAGAKSLAASNGVVVFRGVDAAGKLGIYAVRAGGGPIQKIIAQGDPINGTMVDSAEPSSLTFRRDGFDGTTLVFVAQYTLNTGRGIFSTKVLLPE